MSDNLEYMDSGEIAPFLSSFYACAIPIFLENVFHFTCTVLEASSNGPNTFMRPTIIVKSSMLEMLQPGAIIRSLKLCRDLGFGLCLYSMQSVA